jgi:HAMP domain-containing protein
MNAVRHLKFEIRHFPMLCGKISCMSAGSKPPITDSPWFWVLLFSAVGLVLLFVFSGQIGKRQARLDRQYQARDRVQDQAVGDPARREYSSPESTLVPIWPLAAALGGAILLSAEMLRRAHQSRLAKLRAAR